jgi:predicted enzyme related to lactoylglutathione lyase
MIEKLSTLMVYVHDMPKSVAFYRDVLGLPLEMETPGWSQFDLGSGVALGLHMTRGETKQNEPGWVPGFTVSDIRAARDRVVGAGAQIAQDYHDIPGGVVLEFTDPDGNRVDVSQMGISCADLGVTSH